jgi:hypothetical protein
MVDTLGHRRYQHAAQTLTDAADAACDALEDFVKKAVADDRRHELLTRALSIAQDTALRDKRRALGRALAAGIVGDDACVDDELLFIRTVADVDAPHIRLLGLLAAQTAMAGQKSGNVFQAGWSLDAIAAADPGLGDAVPALLSTLRLHALITDEEPVTMYRGPGAVSTCYNITESGRQFLNRLVENGTG